MGCFTFVLSHFRFVLHLDRQQFITFFPLWLKNRNMSSSPTDTTRNHGDVCTKATSFAGDRVSSKSEKKSRLCHLLTFWNWQERKKTKISISYLLNFDYWKVTVWFCQLMKNFKFNTSAHTKKLLVLQFCPLRPRRRCCQLISEILGGSPSSWVRPSHYYEDHHTIFQHVRNYWMRKCEHPSRIVVQSIKKCFLQKSYKAGF